MFILSGPVELLFELSLMAFVSSSCDKMYSKEFSDFISLFIFLWDLWVECLHTPVNCLLKAFAICWCDERYFPLNLIEAFGDDLVFLFESADMVFHRMWELFLWSQFLSNFSFQMFVLWSEINLFISLFSVVKDKSFGLVFLISFRIVLSYWHKYNCAFSF